MTIAGWVPWVSDAMVLLGLVVMTIGVAGIVRMPEIYTKQHAASKSVFLGVCSILVSVVIAGDPAFAARAVLIGALLTLTTPVAAHEIAKVAAREHAVRPDSVSEWATRQKRGG